MKILVGISGGVDSSVTAMLLKQQGHEVIGARMSLWGKVKNRGGELKAGNKNSKNSCYCPDEDKKIEEAERVCKQIGIPFHVLNCEDEYERIVLDNFKQEYLSGRTPNPCIRCNSNIKFGALPAAAKKAGIIFDKFATGHYARVVKDEQTGRYLLKTGTDMHKDQTYFLYRLTQEQLSRVIFPLGEYTKEQIKKIAEENHLPVLDKPESQDFYSGDYNDLLGITPKEGNIVDKQGNVLGRHNGIWNYTLGQRKGICISAPQALYVIGLDKEKNEVIVGYEEDTFSNSLIAGDLNWIPFDRLDNEMHVKAKIRSFQNAKNAIIRPNNDGNVTVEFVEPQKAITPGQSIVFYAYDLVLGGGIIVE